MVLNVRESIINAPIAYSFTLNRATLVDGTFPGPLIAAKKVSFFQVPGRVPVVT